MLRGPHLTLTYRLLELNGNLQLQVSKALSHLSAKEDAERSLEAALKAKAFAEDTALSARAEADSAKAKVAAAIANSVATAEAEATVAMASVKLGQHDFTSKPTLSHHHTIIPS